ncbi:MAG: hypothetical protein AAGC54_09365 [Cyanobacteria bacterium P01_F01_bin.4]
MLTRMFKRFQAVSFKEALASSSMGMLIGIGTLLSARAVFANTTDLSTHPQTADIAILAQLDPSIPGDRIALIRAKNEARQAAEHLNGGLTVYRAEPAMHGSVDQLPYVLNEDGTLTFTFFGGSPSEVAEGTYSIESVVIVNPRDRTTTIDYNGPIREAQ